MPDVDSHLPVSQAVAARQAVETGGQDFLGTTPQSLHHHLVQPVLQRRAAEIGARGTDDLQGVCRRARQELSNVALRQRKPEKIRLNAIAQINESTPVGQAGGTQPRTQLLHGTPHLSQSRPGRQAGPQASVFHAESKPPGTGIGTEPYLAQFKVSKHTFIHGNNKAMFSTAQKNGFSSRKAKRNRFSGQQKRTKCTDTDTGQKHNTLVIKNLFPWHGFWTLQ